MTLLSGFYLELLFWRESERVEDNFIMIYTDVFNQALPLGKTFGWGGGGGGGGGSIAIIRGRSFPLPPQ